MSLSLSGCGLSLSLSVFRRSLATAKISSTVATGCGSVSALVFTSKFTFLSFRVIVLPFRKNKNNTQKMSFIFEQKHLWSHLSAVPKPRHHKYIRYRYLHKQEKGKKSFTSLIDLMECIMWKVAAESFHSNVIISHGDISKADRGPCCLLNGPPFPQAIKATSGLREGGDGRAAPSGPFSIDSQSTEQVEVIVWDSAWSQGSSLRADNRMVFHSLFFTNIVANLFSQQCPQSLLYFSSPSSVC